jgi:hypothetical protein
MGRESPANPNVPHRWSANPNILRIGMRDLFTALKPHLRIKASASELYLLHENEQRP